MFSLSQFLTYVVIVDFTPGPNTMTSMSNGVRFGFKRTLPFMGGLILGQSVIMALVGLFSKALFDYLPGVKPFMLVIGAAYMLYLAYKIWHSGEPKGADGKKDVSATFFTGVFLQFINPKFLLFALTTMSNYILPYFTTLPAIAAKAAIIPLGGFSSVMLWAAFGSLFYGFYSRHAKLVNAIMALALVYCAVALFL
ncbi:MAG: LysE family transporter [Candidatus Pelethousia sp.]|nr:LysE family transporter [Candidatus Pelethousia sp.]